MSVTVEEFLAKRLNQPEKWICSELAAYALDEQPEYKDCGVLKSLNATISPQELFEDTYIFEPWKKDGIAEQCSGKDGDRSERVAGRIVV